MTHKKRILTHGSCGKIRIQEAHARSVVLTVSGCGVLGYGRWSTACQGPAASVFIV
jgi:hypothetical protein